MVKQDRLVLTMDTQRKSDVLKHYYFNPKNAAAFAGPQKLFQVLDRKYPGQFTLAYVRSWLNNQDAYSIQKPIRYHFKTAQVRVNGINDQWDIDLLSMNSLAKENDNVHYLFCAIDIFSRKLWVQPLQNKTAKAVLQAMTELLKHNAVKTIRSDKGAEMKNTWFKALMKKKGIYFFVTQNPPKANYVERVQRTLKAALYRMMRHRRSYRYIDHLQDVVANYNNTPHSSLGGLAPNDVTKDNEADVWAFQYLRPSARAKRTIPSFAFKMGSLVRISFLKHPFRKAFNEQYTTEVFKIVNRFLKQGIPMYTLEDMKGRSIVGHFYQAELQNVNKDEHSVWFIETILKKRRRQKRMQYYVKWDGFPKEYNSWVDAADIKDSRVTEESTKENTGENT